MLCRLITTCKVAIAKVRNHPRPSTIEQGLLVTIRVLMESLWYLVGRYIEPTAEWTKDRHEMWTPLRALWKEFGIVCGLSLSDYSIENFRPWSEQISLFGSVGFSQVRCSWPLCLCSLDAHHRMKVCKGCWHDRYCSRHCQEMCVL